jgi:hypothetical protein
MLFGTIVGSLADKQYVVSFDFAPFLRMQIPNCVR